MTARGDVVPKGLSGPGLCIREDEAAAAITGPCQDGMRAAEFSVFIPPSARSGVRTPLEMCIIYNVEQCQLLFCKGL